MLSWLGLVSLIELGRLSSYICISNNLMAWWKDFTICLSLVESKISRKVRMISLIRIVSWSIRAIPWSLNRTITCSNACPTWFLNKGHSSVMWVGAWHLVQVGDDTWFTWALSFNSKETSLREMATNLVSTTIKVSMTWMPLLEVVDFSLVFSHCIAFLSCLLRMSMLLRSFAWKNLGTLVRGWF